MAEIQPARPAQAEPPAKTQPEEEKVPLLAVLHDLGSTLTQSDLPSPSQLQHVVGAMVKVMEHGGVQVADELWPEEPTVVARPETADQVHRQHTNSRLDRLEGLLGELLGHVRGSSSGSEGSDSGKEEGGQ